MIMNEKTMHIRYIFYTTFQKLMQHGYILATHDFESVNKLSKSYNNMVGKESTIEQNRLL